MTTVSDETSNAVPAEPDPDAAPDAVVTDADGNDVTSEEAAATDSTDEDAAEGVGKEPADDTVDSARTDPGPTETEGAGETDETGTPDADVAGSADEAIDDSEIEAAGDDEQTAETVEAVEVDHADDDTDDAVATDIEATEDNDDPTDDIAADDQTVDADDAVVPASAATQLDPDDDTWWKAAIFYQIYPRSFSDLDGDGVGDLAGVIDKLGYLELLGVDALWLSPIMRSPMADHGYDVSDPRDIDPIFGDLARFDELIAEAHERSIRVTMDLVPNHTSDQHPWFVEALAAEPGSSERARYIFRDGRGDDGDEPPNNWQSIFGGPAWTRVPDPDGTPGQWYLHIFAAEQPDLNWENPEVFDDLEKTLRFWLDRGVDGFRIDVAHGMAKPADLPDMDLESAGLLQNDDDDPRFNNYAVHDIHRKIRKVLDEYPGAANVGEIWVDDNERFAEYLRPDELHLGFNFRLAKATFDTESIRDAIENSLEAVLSVSGVPTWTLSNHDVDREVSRYGRIAATPAGADPADVDVESSDTDIDLGILRARAMLLVELALPGTVFIYNGAELGLPNADLPDGALQDPVWERSGHTERGRDACRVPLPWEGVEPPFGFSSNPDTWLPMPASWTRFTVEAQLEDIGSTLSLYRQAIEMRYERPEFEGDTVEWYGAPDGCLAFRRSVGHLTCALNTGDVPVPLPPGEILLTSYPLIDGQLAPNSAAWLV
ncbi:alpha-amylase family glycosyl hydrolase [Gordonia sp. SL306]|uniref:alpha-amylase family glycosyl hydrolase n=1 Tax=Gordonia sp. SL306 TaxID=2995145 RepID=UPI00226F35C4|nr:alpha-amylase family glycosyl hydrolase [Gordonia sp. SL306]WAC55033.1 alpha-amylase family glycosyl hydrolase [Gordonia sp. SL306]